MISRYRLKITGKNPDYFIRNLIRKNISIYDMETSFKEVMIIVDEHDYQKIKEMKTIYKIEIVGRIGLCKYRHYLRKYAVFFLCCGFGILLNLFLSHLIFEVEVVHPNREIQSLVKNDLKEYGIQKFHFKVPYEKKEQIVKKILKKETNDLEWLEIEEVGVKYVVKVEQRKKNKKEEVCPEQSIVAKKNAMILEIQAISGEVLVKKLDYVKKGDVLISGLIHNKEEIVSKRCAKGQVFGEIWYRVEVEVPTYYREEKVTGKKKKQLELQFLNQYFTLFSTFKTYQKKTKTLFESDLLPIRLQLVDYLETKVTEENYTIQNVEEKAIAFASKKLKTKLGKEDTILTKKVLKKTKKNSKIIVEVFFKVKEDITDTLSLKDFNIEQEAEPKEE